MWRIPILLKCLGPGFVLVGLLFIFAWIDSNAAGERVDEVSWPNVGPNHFYAESGGDAADTTMSVGNYNVMNASLTETFDTRGCFTVVSGNEICYGCVPSINTHITWNISFAKTVSTAFTITTFAIGIGATTTIDDGDEEGEEHVQTMATGNDKPHNASIMKSIQLTTDDCVALLGKADNNTGGADYVLEAASVVISEF